MDFMHGAALAPHRRPILALPATARAPKTSAGSLPYALMLVDGQISRIVPVLTPRAAVTSPGCVEGMQVEVDIGGEIQAEGVASDEQVWSRISPSVLTQQMTQMEQANAQGCSAMQGVPFWPEQLGEVLAQMEAAFHPQVEQEREFLARGDQQHLVAVGHM